MFPLLWSRSSPASPDVVTLGGTEANGYADLIHHEVISAIPKWQLVLLTTSSGLPPVCGIREGLWGVDLMMFTKYIVVVDDVNVHNASEVLFRLCANTDPGRKSEVRNPKPEMARGPADVLDHATNEIAIGSTPRRAASGEALNPRPRLETGEQVIASKSLSSKLDPNACGEYRNFPHPHQVAYEASGR